MYTAELNYYIRNVPIDTCKEMLFVLQGCNKIAEWRRPWNIKSNDRGQTKYLWQIKKKRSESDACIAQIRRFNFNFEEYLEPIMWDESMKGKHFVFTGYIPRIHR